MTLVTGLVSIVALMIMFALFPGLTISLIVVLLVFSVAPVAGLVLLAVVLAVVFMIMIC